MTRPDRRILLLAAASALLAGCGGGPPPSTFDLSAPRGAVRRLSGGGRAIVVQEPSAIAALDSERIVVRAANSELTYLPRAQWADRLPRLVQARLIQTFENRGRAAVGRPTDRIVGDVQLIVDIRNFEVREASREAYVEIAAKIVGGTSGDVATARLFSASAPVGAIDGAGATAALDRALARVLLDVTGWAGAGR
jgi:cholesterol transport system auxiliary component